MRAQLGLREAVPLLTAHVIVLAERAGIRTLVIKGEALSLQCLRPPQISSDVDLIVDPRRRDELVMLLKRQGWRPRRVSKAPRYFPIHSVTLFHPQWPCDIDIHDSYPGLFLEKQHLFDQLWVGREIHQVAHVPVFVVDRDAHALVYAAHILRDSAPEEVDGKLRELAHWHRDKGGRVCSVELARQALELRASTALRRYLVLICNPDHVDDDLNDSEREAWQLHRLGNGSSLNHWWHAFHKSTLVGKPLVVLRFLGTYTAQLIEEMKSCRSASEPRLPYLKRLKNSVVSFREARRRQSRY